MPVTSAMSSVDGRQGPRRNWLPRLTMMFTVTRSCRWVAPVMLFSGSTGTPSSSSQFSVWRVCQSRNSSTLISFRAGSTMASSREQFALQDS